MRNDLSRAILIATLCSASLTAQGVSGSIAGLLKDPHGAAVAAATVTATHVATALKFATLSGEDGYYRLSNMVPGEYILEFSAPGFRKFTSIAQAVGVAEPLRLDATLVVGDVAESITVESAATRVNTEDSQQGVTIREVSRLPLLSGAGGRSPVELLFLSPGTVKNPASGVGLLSANGQRVYSNNVIFDGGYANLQVFNSGDDSTAVSPNAVSEIRFVSGPMKAEFGRNSGSAVIITPKSGGNQFHGGASQIFRNTKLNAVPFFRNALPGGTRESLANGTHRKPQWNSNDFDANLGGPIRRETTFFFASYLGFRRRQGIVNSATVPNDAQRHIVETQGTPEARALLGLIPRATYGNSLLSAPSNAERHDQGLTKIDHSLAPSNRISATYFVRDYALQAPFTSGSRVPGFGITNTVRQQNLVVRDTHVLTPRLFHDFRTTLTRTSANNIIPENRTKLSSLGLEGVVPDNAAAEGPPYVRIAGFEPFGNSPSGPQLFRIRNLQVLDQVSWSHPRHLVKTGAEFRTFAVDSTLEDSPNGTIQIDGSGSDPSRPIVRRLMSGLTPAMNDFANGFAREFRQSSSARVGHRGRAVALFIQDDFRARPGFSLNLGVRWEFHSPYTDIRDRVVTFRPGQQSTIFPDAPVGLVFPGDSGVPRSTYRSDLNDFSPRFGFAWDVLKSGTLSIRGGYGFHYDAPFDEILFLASVFSPPYNISPGVAATDYSNPWPSSRVRATQQPFPYHRPRAGDPVDFTALAPLNLAFLDPTFRTPYVHQWNLQVQYQLPDDWLFEVAYAGNAGFKLSNEREFNFAVPGAGATAENTDERRFLNVGNLENTRFGGNVFGSLSLHAGNSNSSYNALQVHVTRRFARGFFMSHAYTWSHAIDSGSARAGVRGGQSRTGAGSRPDPRQDRGNSDQDVRHNYAMAYVYELPFYQRQTRGLARILGGWGVSGRTAIRTGFWGSILEPQDRCLCATGNQRADTIGAPIKYLDPRSTSAVAGRPNSWFDGTGGGTPTAAGNPYFRRIGSGPAFAQGAGRYGSAGRNTIRLPGMNQWHLMAVKRTTVREGQYFEFRAEFYNVLNHADFLTPDLNIGSPTFGIVTQTLDPRIVQFAVRYIF